MSAWERAQSAAEEAELRAAIEASLLDAAPAGDIAKANVPKSPAKGFAKVREHALHHVFAAHQKSKIWRY